MEENKSAASSDRDKKMMGSFENYSDGEKTDKKKTKRSPEAPLSSLFEQSKDDDKAEKNDSLLDFLLLEDKDGQPEVAEVPEDPESISDDEAGQIIEQYVDGRADELREELEATDEDSAEEAEILADAAFLEAVKEKVAQGEEVDEAALDQLVDETAEALGLETAKEAEEETELTDEENELETIDDTEAAAEDDPQTSAAQTTTPPVSPPPPTPPNPPVPPTPPPTPPIPPIPPGPNLPPPPGPNVIPPVPPTPNVVTASPNITPASPNTLRTSRKRAGDMLLGAAVGYLIGRRRGRIKTEARLLPVQEKLEQQVQELHQQIEQREERIRNLAAETVKTQPETARPALVERLASRREQHREDKAAETVRIPEMPLPVPEQQPPRERPPRRPEVLARFLMPRPEAAAPLRTEVAAKSVELMTMPELLMVADRIERNGVTVREMYENNRLDAVGLRRVIYEYLHGRQVERVLTENLKPLATPEALSNSATDSRIQNTTAADGAAPIRSSDSPVSSSAQQPIPALPATPSVSSAPPTQLSNVSKPRYSQNQIAVGVGIITAVILLIVWALFA